MIDELGSFALKTARIWSEWWMRDLSSSKRQLKFEIIGELEVFELRTARSAKIDWLLERISALIYDGTCLYTWDGDEFF